MWTVAEAEERSKSLRLKVRFDYQVWAKGSRFPFKSPSLEKAAEEMREQKVALLRNVPVQGILIEDISMSGDVYSVYDENRRLMTAFAPVTIGFTADSIEDTVHFIMKEEFRKVELIEPEQMTLNKIDIERMLFKVNEELKSYRSELEKKANWK